MAENQSRPRPNGGPRGGNRTQQQQPDWKDDLTRQAFSLYGGQDDWYAQRRQAADEVDFSQVLERLNHRMSVVGGQPLKGQSQVRDDFVASFQNDLAQNPDFDFMAGKAEAAAVGDNKKLEQMTTDLRHCEGIVKHFESEVEMERSKLKAEMAPFFDSVYTTSIMAQDTFERVAASPDPKKELMECLKATDADMEAAAKLDLDGMLAEAKGESRLFAQIALKDYPDLFGDLKGEVVPDKLFRKGGPNAERRAAFDKVRAYHPEQFAEGEMRLAHAEVNAVMAKEKFQSIDRNYRKALEVELLSKLDKYNHIMAERAQGAEQESGISRAQDGPQPEVALQESEKPASQKLDGMRWEMVPSEDDPSKMVMRATWPDGKPASEPEQVQEQGESLNPHGFKEVKRPRMMTEKQLAAAQQRFEKAFPQPLKEGENPLGLKVAQRPRFITEKQLTALQTRFAKAYPEVAAPEKANDYVPMHTVQKEAREAAKASKAGNAPEVQEAAVPTPKADQPELRATRDEPVAERTQDMPELRATRDDDHEVLGRAGTGISVSREDAEAAGKAHLYKKAPEAVPSLSDKLSYDELKESLRDLDARIQEARARHDKNPAIGTDKWWDQSR